MIKDGQPLGYFMQITQNLPARLGTMVVVVGFDAKGEIMMIRGFDMIHVGPVRSNLNQVVMPRLIGKKRSEIKISPAECYGMEYHAQMLAADLRHAMTVYKQARKRAEQVTDPYDMEDSKMAVTR